MEESSGSGLQFAISDILALGNSTVLKWWCGGCLLFLYSVEELIDEKCLHKSDLIEEVVLLTRCTLLFNLVSVVLLLVLGLALCLRKL